MKRGMALLLTGVLLCLLAGCHVRQARPTASTSTPEPGPGTVLVVKSEETEPAATSPTGEDPAKEATAASPSAPWYETAENVVASYFDGALHKIREEQGGVVRYGIADREGNVILPAEYLWVGVIDEDRLVATAGDAPGLEFSRAWIFDVSGNVISAGEYNSIDYFQRSDGTLTPYGVAFQNEKFYLVDRDGESLDGRAWDWLAFEEEYTLSGVFQGETYTVDMSA